MYAAVETELVDFKTLNAEAGDGRSDELMRHVAMLFSLTSEHCTDEQVSTYETVMQRLADLVGIETRSFAAEKLSRLEKAPHAIIRRFAFDTIRVAGPVLSNSPVLNDQDLIEVSDEKGVEHMLAISTRQDLSPDVTDVLIRSEYGSVLIKLAANGDATISAVGMDFLKKAAEKDLELARCLEEREIRHAVVKDHQTANSDAHRHTSLQDVWEKMQSTLPDNVHDLSNHPYLARYDFGPSLAKVDRLSRQDRLNRQILRQFANYDQFADVVCGIAALSGIPHTIIAQMMSSLNWEQILSVFKFMSFSDRMVADLLCCGPWKLRLSRNQCFAIVKQYRQMSVEQARSKVLLWPQDGLILE